MYSYSVWLSTPLSVSRKVSLEGSHSGPPLVQVTVARWRSYVDETLLLGSTLVAGEWKAGRRVVLAGYCPQMLPTTRGNKLSLSSYF